MGIQDVEAIRRLLAEYCFFADSRETERWCGLFTEDCHFSSPYGDYHGHAGLREWQAKSDRSPNAVRHLTVNSVIDVDGDSAEARSYVVVVDCVNNNKITFVGTYRDQLAKIGGKWLFRERIAVPNDPTP